MVNILLFLVTTAVYMASAVPVASAPPFMCGTTSVCNLERGQPDQYCTSGPEGRCKSCADEASRCFTERMAFNCTSYCRELDKEATLTAAREMPCSRLGDLTNGNHNATDSPRPGDIVQPTCDPGHRLEGNDIIRCLEFGVWSGDLPNCKVIECTGPSIPNGVLQADTLTTAVGEYVGYSCDEGYSPADPKSRTQCLSDGTWSGATCYQVVLVHSNNDAVMIALYVVSGVGFLMTIALIVAYLKIRRQQRDMLSMMDDKNLYQNKNAPAQTEDSEESTFTGVKVDSEQTHRMQYFNEHDVKTTNDKKTEAIPLLPRNNSPESPVTVPPPDQQNSNSHTSLPSMARSTDSTARKDVPESDPLPSGDETSMPGVKQSRSSSLGSDVKGGAGINVNITFHSPINTNSNTNINNSDSKNSFKCSNDNSNNESGNTPFKERNGFIPNTHNVEKSNNETEEKCDSPDKPRFPTQEESQDNSNTGAAGDTAGHYAHPTENGKTGKLALPKNTVSLGDVKRRRSVSSS